MVPDSSSFVSVEAQDPSNENRKNAFYSHPIDLTLLHDGSARNIIRKNEHFLAELTILIIAQLQ